MIVVGLTGGIGSGKSTVAAMFNSLGIPIYIADKEAKRLMKTSKIIKRELTALFGIDAYVNDELNRSFIASKIYSNGVLLEKMNAIIHPKVAKDFSNWLQKQSAPYIIKEAAIIFEHQKEANYNKIIMVTASVEERIKRVKARDHTTEEKIRDIMNNQLSDEEKIKKSDYVIENNDLEDTKKQVLEIHERILRTIQL